MNLLIFFQIYLVKLLFPRYYLLPTSLLYAQAKHETGNFKSRIYLQNHNLFGMKLPRIRKTTALKSRYGHAVYKNNWTSIYDYFLRQNNFNIDFKNTQQYVKDTTNSGYAEDKKYSHKWLANYFSLGSFRFLGYFILPTILTIPILFVLDFKAIKNLAK